MAKTKENKLDIAVDSTGTKEKGSFIKSLLIFVFSLVVLLLLFLVLLRLNLLGIGTALTPSMGHLPLAHLYLPSPNPDLEMDPETGQASGDLSQETLAETKEILKLTESELKKKEEEVDILLKQLQGLKQENERLAVFEAKQVEFEQDKQKFDALVVESGDKAAFVDWYQKMNPDNAARLYQATVMDLAVQEELDHLTRVYAEMKPKAAAKVLETMGTTRLEMVAMIIKGLDTDQAGKIMSEIDPKVAARITTYLYPEN